MYCPEVRRPAPHRPVDGVRPNHDLPDQCLPLDSALELDPKKKARSRSRSGPREAASSPSRSRSPRGHEPNRILKYYKSEIQQASSAQTPDLQQACSFKLNLIIRTHCTAPEAFCGFLCVVLMQCVQYLHTSIYMPSMLQAKTAGWTTECRSLLTCVWACNWIICSGPVVHKYRRIYVIILQHNKLPG